MIKIVFVHYMLNVFFSLFRPVVACLLVFFLRVEKEPVWRVRLPYCLHGREFEFFFLITFRLDCLRFFRLFLSGKCTFTLFLFVRHFV